MGVNMGLFSRDKKDYNEKLKDAVEDYINTEGLKKAMKVNEIKKYASKKLKKEKWFSSEQMQMLKDVTSHFRANKILKYSPSTLRMMYLSNEEYKKAVLEEGRNYLLNVKEVPVIFPKIEETTTNNVGLGALGGGLLFGATGAIIGASMGANSQKTNRKIVGGERGKLRIAEKGVVISNREETIKIPWNQIKGMKRNILELGEGKHMTFYEILHREAVSDIINDKAEYIGEEGW